MSLHRRPAPSLLALLLPLALLVGGCSASLTASGAPSQDGSAQPTPTAAASETPMPENSPTPSPTPSPDAQAADPVVVTFLVAGEQEYRILLTEAEDIAIARQLLAGEEAPRIPNGLVVRDGDGGVNAGYSWHIDPRDVEFADVTVEVCDGMPSDVEAEQISGERFCPWSAEVIDIQPAA